MHFQGCNEKYSTKPVSCLKSRLFEYEHCRGLIYMADVLFSITAQSDCRYIRKDLFVFAGQVFLFHFQRSEYAVYVDDSGNAPQFLFGLRDRVLGVGNDIRRF